MQLIDACREDDLKQSEVEPWMRLPAATVRVVLVTMGIEWGLALFAR